MISFTKIDATCTKTNFFEFWFFCWVKKLTYYEHLKRFLRLLIKWDCSSDCMSCVILFDWRFIIWQFLQKLTLPPQKSTFLNSDFFAELKNWHTLNTWKDFWGCSKNEIAVVTVFHVKILSNWRFIIKQFLQKVTLRP